MKIRTYCYGAISFIAALCGVMAFSFYRMGFVGIGPFVLAVLLVAAGIIGVAATLPKGAKKQKKPKNAKKAKQEELPAEGE